MSTFTFTTTDYDGPEQIEVVTVTGRSDTWTEQADLFFRFLLAQGFMVSENDLAEFFLEKADEIGQNRASEGAGRRRHRGGRARTASRGGGTRPRSSSLS